MGIWQGIYLCEFRNHGGGRKIVATVMGGITFSDVHPGYYLFKK